MLGQAELLPAGHQLGEAVLLFRKIEDAEIDAQIARLEAIKAEREAAEKAREAAEAAKKVEPQKPEVTFEQFGVMASRRAIWASISASSILRNSSTASPS